MSRQELTSSAEGTVGFSAILMPLLALPFLLFFLGGASGPVAGSLRIDESTVCSRGLIGFIGVEAGTSKDLYPPMAGDFGDSSSSFYQD
jgi:hypothetical protein